FVLGRRGIDPDRLSGCQSAHQVGWPFRRRITGQYECPGGSEIVGGRLYVLGIEKPQRIHFARQHVTGSVRHRRKIDDGPGIGGVVTGELWRWAAPVGNKGEGGPGGVQRLERIKPYTEQG